MSARDFDKRMAEICKSAKTLTALEALARALIEEELGANAYAYVAGIDLFCRRAREIGHTPKEFGPPTRASIGKYSEQDTAL